MKRPLLRLIAAGSTAFFGFIIARRKSGERAKPQRAIKETFWSKLVELWTIRRRCRDIRRRQQQDRPLRTNECSAAFLRQDSQNVSES
jgi:hypothetical protein